jgi:hypothetical protein
MTLPVTSGLSGGIPPSTYYDDEMVDEYGVL